MTPEEFINGLADAGYPFAEDDPDYCQIHGWNCDHQWRCTPNSCYTEDFGPRERCCQ